jgi:predicted DNA-binding transcriptional regulator AlpA
LDEVAADPSKATALPPEAVKALLARCTIAHGVLVAQLLEVSQDGTSATQATHEDRLLDVGDAAQRLGVSPDWLYRRVGKLPFVVRLGRTVRCSAAGLDRYIRQRQGR